MHRAPRAAVTVMACLSLAACASDRLSPDVSRGTASYSSMTAAQTEAAQLSYRIHTLDQLNITVFDEPQLSVVAGQVDDEGRITVPLLGPVPAEGLTTDDLAASVTRRLSPQYVRDPRVSVTVAASQARKITVEGEVKSPGIFPILGETTLLQAVALGGGESSIAKLSQVIVLRTVNGRRSAALFDLNAIRTARAPDPEILPRDVIIVGKSRARQLWQDLLQAIPVFNLFRYY